MFSNYALKLWGEIIPFLRSEDELTEELADKLMLTSTIAGMAIAQTGTSIPAVSYTHLSSRMTKALNFLCCFFSNSICLTKFFY